MSTISFIDNKNCKGPNAVNFITVYLRVQTCIKEFYDDDDDDEDDDADVLMRVAGVAYRVVQIEVDEDQLDAFSDFGAWSQGDVTADVGRVDGRVARRHDGAIAATGGADHVRAASAVY